MNNIKLLFKNKKFLISFIVVFLLIIGMVVFVILNNKEAKKLKEEKYSAYIINGNNAVLKIDFKENYYECIKNSKKEVCGEITNKVMDFELLNNLSFEINLKDMDIEKAIILFINTLTENVTEINDLIILSNYEFASDFKEQVEDNITSDINLIISYQENFEDMDLSTFYTVTFDSDGGSSIDSVVVKKGDKVQIPNEPNKDNYTFLGWYLNDEKYDFDQEVKEDITLIAKWEKNKDSNNINVSNNSSSEKINLNNNVNATIYYKDTGDENCFFYMFVKNLQEVYPDAEITDYTNNIKHATYWSGPSGDRATTEISNDDLNNGNLSFDSNKESKLQNIFAKYENSVGINIDRFKLANHRIYYTYQYITFNGLNVADGTNANKEIENALATSTLFQGPCGGYDYYENVIVDENICSLYNLDCDRW